MTVDSTPVVYELQLTVEDPVFFSSQEMNKRITTSKYLHNYALTYALIHAAGKPELLSEYSQQYERQIQEPNYEADLRPLSFYIYPAAPQNVSFTSEIVNTTSEQFEETVDADRGKLYFSGHEIRRIAVGSTFRTFLLADSDKTAEITSPIRLGKFRGKVRADTDRHSVQVDTVEDTTVSAALNTVDVPNDFASRISNISMSEMRPTPLITSAKYTGPAYTSDTITLPRDVHYFEAEA